MWQRASEPTAVHSTPAAPLPLMTFPSTILRRRKAVQADLDALLAQLREQAGLGLHLGAGGCKLPGMINCDLHDPRADRRIDAIDLATFEEASVDLIETHHMIEHLSFEEAEQAFAEWSRVLKPRGLLVMTCPDVTRVCLRWLFYTLLHRFSPCAEQRNYTLQMMVGSQQHAGMFHKSAYDARRLRCLLAKVGLTVEFSYTPYPNRRTPSLLTIARKA